MKKLLLFPILFISLLIQAQPVLHGGIKIAPTFGWLKVESENPSILTVENNGTNIGFAYGAFANYFIKDNFGISAELRHALQSYGFTIRHKGSSDYATQKLSLQYVEIPLTFIGRSNEVGYVRYFGQFGFMPAL